MVAKLEGTPHHNSTGNIMKLGLKLNGSQIDCNIGYSLLTAAASKIKEDRHADFRKTIDAIAQAGPNDAAKESILSAFREHTRTQVPTDQEVRQWLLTSEGQLFCLIHGTRNYPTKLTQETAGIVLDDMTEEEATSLADAIGNLCYGAEMSKINRETSREMVKMARLELDSLKKEVSEALNPPQPTISESPDADKTN